MRNRVDPVEYESKSQKTTRAGSNDPYQGPIFFRIEIYSTGLTKIENQSISEENCLSFLK